MDNSFTSSSADKQSNDPHSVGQLSDSGSPQSGTQQSCQTEILSIDDKLNRFLLSSEQSLLKVENLPQVDHGISQLMLLAQKINFLRNNNRNFDHVLEMLCYYNISCGYQVLTFNRYKNNALEQCLKYLKMSIDLNKAIIFKNEKQQLYLKQLRIRMNIQYCALLSQIDNHSTALEVSVQALADIQSLFVKSYEICKENLNKAKSSGQQKVSFTQNVLSKAKELLQKLRLIENFQKIMKTDPTKQQNFKRLKDKNYFWQSNFENNQKTIRKQFNEEPLTRVLPKTVFPEPIPSKSKHIPNRNILGVKVSNDWITAYTIGKIMHMIPLKYSNYCSEDNFIFEFNYKNLIEKVFLLSAIYFSIATQMRFLEGINKPNDKQKFSYNSNNKEQFKKSQIFHLKAIQTICKYVKESSAFTDHLINSYHRHYNLSLATIEEQPSFAEYSIMSSENMKKSKKNFKMNFQLNIHTTDYNESGRFKRNEKQREKYKEKQREKQREKQKQKDNSMPIFIKKKKQKNLMESGQLQEFSRSSKNILSKGNPSKVFIKFQSTRQKSEKSISSTHFHSMKSADKKSFSIKKNHMTLMVKSKSPQPSFKTFQTKRTKEQAKKSQMRLTRR